jgi:hypothetical protein
LRQPVPCRRLGDRIPRHRTTSSLEPSQRSSDPSITWPAGTDHRRLPQGHATHCGRTPTISTHANANNSTG